MRILILLVAVLAIVLFSSQTSMADTNTKSATVLVVKHVINNDGGTAQASDFDITVDHSSDVSASPYSFSGSEEGTLVTLTGNFNQLAHFTVHESLENNYQSHLSSNCNTYINAGESLVCVITNDDKPATSNTASSYAKADFGLSITHPTVNLEQGSGTYSSSVLLIDSTILFPSDVKVEVSVDPPGLGVTARDEGYSTVQSPGTLQTHLLNGKYSLDDLLYVDVGPYTPPGTYHVIVKVSADLGDGVITKTTTLTVNVTAPRTFSVSVSPNEVTVVQGGSVNTDVTVTSNEPHQYGLYVGAGNGADLHSGLTFAFPNLPSPVSEGPYSHGAIGTPISTVPGSPVTTPLTITAADNAPLGKHTIWVNAHGQVLVNPIVSDVFLNSNMYVPVTVNVVSKGSTSGLSSTTGTSGSSTNSGSSSGSSSTTSSSSTTPSTQSGGQTGLRVLKKVNNDGGGTKGPQDFTPDIDLIHGGSTYNNDHYGFPANGDMLITSGYNPGDRYQVHEELDPNYQVKYLDDCYGTIEAGKVKTCIIVNTYITNSGSSSGSSSTTSSSSTTPSTQSGGQTGLRVLKKVNNDGGGTKGPQDFTPDIDLIHGGSTYNNDHYGFPANGDMLITSGYNPGDRYQVHEELDPNYQTTYLDDCYGTIEAGKVKTCIVVNTYITTSASATTSSSSSTGTSTTQTTNSAQQNYLIPSWVRNNAKWWSQGQTSDSDFASGIGYLVTNKIIKADSRGTLGSTIVVSANMQIPSWIKNDANYWALGSIDDNTFLQGIQYMLDNNIITFSTHNTVKPSPATNSNQQLKLQQVLFHFLDSDTGNPVDALVTIGGGITYMEKETNTDGSLEVSLPPGSYTVTADADKYQRSTSTFEVKENAYGLATTIYLKKFISESTEQTPTTNTSPSQSSTVPQVTTPTTTPTTPSTPTVPSTPQAPLTVSISQTSASFIHNIGSSPCPTPITMAGLASNQQGSWQLTSAPSWISVVLNGNQVMIGFNCQLQSYNTQTLNGDVTFTFTSLDGHTASASISITGQIQGQS